MISTCVCGGGGITHFLILFSFWYINAICWHLLNIWQVNITIIWQINITIYIICKSTSRLSASQHHDYLTVNITIIWQVNITIIWQVKTYIVGQVDTKIWQVNIMIWCRLVRWLFRHVRSLCFSVNFWYELRGGKGVTFSVPPYVNIGLVLSQLCSKAI